jgi:hypothetical protein
MEIARIEKTLSNWKVNEKQVRTALNRFLKKDIFPQMNRVSNLYFECIRADGRFWYVQGMFSSGVIRVTFGLIWDAQTECCVNMQAYYHEENKLGCGSHLFLFPKDPTSAITFGVLNTNGSLETGYLPPCDSHVKFILAFLLPFLNLPLAQITVAFILGDHDMVVYWK